MKKILSVMLIALMLLPCFAAFASSAESTLPFELVPPAYVSAAWLEENDSPTTAAISYSLSNEMTEFFKKAEQAHADDGFETFMSQYGYDDIYMTTQVDWAVDDVNDSVSGWHCNEYWNADYGFGYDSEYRIRVGEWDGVDLWIGNATDTVNKHWVTRGVSEYGFNGDPESQTPGLKDQLRPDQYTYSDGELHIDYTKHTVYYRMRFVVTVSRDTDEGTQFEYFYSDWSNTASVGKGANAYEPLTKADLDAPVISGLRMTDQTFNDNPVVAFTLTVPDKLAENATKVAAAGGTIYIETYARVKGDSEWTHMQNTDHTVKAGEMECALLHLVNDERPVISADTLIELRCRYFCTQPEKDDIYSDYSDIITFGTDDISQHGSPATETTGEGEKDSCPICHFCPQPLGLCIFIWLIIIIAVIVIIIVIIASAKKNKKKKK